MDSKKIFIVDDDPDFVAATKTVLESKPYKCESAYSAKESLEKVKGVKPDLILLDIMMETPEAGLEVVSKLKNRDKNSEYFEYSKIPILLVTALDTIDKKSIKEFIESNAIPVDAVLEKPISPQILLSRVEELTRTITVEEPPVEKVTEISVEEMLKKAKKPAEDAMWLHPFYQGKLAVVPKCCVRDFSDFAIWYTPGVAAPCRDIQKNPEKVYEHTNKGNFVAVVTDGTRVLGLGDIGPEASLPVMEGKGLLFKYLGGVDAFPIALNEKDPDKFIEIVKSLEPTFGGINLEDICQPKCFYILDRLRKEMKIPVWHDDQQGTAAVTLAGMINAVKVVGKKMEEIKVAMVGAGAANIPTLRMLVAYGATPGNIIMTDIHGIVSRNRPNFQEHFPHDPIRHLLEKTNSEDLRCAEPQEAIQIALKDADAVICYSKPGPGTVKPEWLKKMAKDAIVFACANPIPEIWPWEAKEAGARIVATGRSDFPNQVNNSLGFPAIFRGVLDVWAKTITDGMCIEAAKSLARSAEKNGIHEEYIVPKMSEFDVYVEEAVACGLRAIKDKVARRILTEDELRASAEEKIMKVREHVFLLMNEGIIPSPNQKKNKVK